MDFIEATTQARTTATETGKWTAVIESPQSAGRLTYSVQSFDKAPKPKTFTDLGIVAWEVPA